MTGYPDPVGLHSLRASVEHLYTVFAVYPRPRRIQTDGRDIDQTDPSGMLSKLLRSLAPANLRVYAHKAMTTTGPSRTSSTSCRGCSICAHLIPMDCRIWQSASARSPMAVGANGLGKSSRPSTHLHGNCGNTV